MLPKFIEYSSEYFVLYRPLSWILLKKLVGWLCWGLTSQSTIFQSYWDGAIPSWVINQYFRGVKCLAQGHNTAAVGLEPRTSRSGVRHSTTEPPRSPFWRRLLKLSADLLYSKLRFVPHNFDDAMFSSFQLQSANFLYCFIQLYLVGAASVDWSINLYSVRR